MSIFRRHFLAAGAAAASTLTAVAAALTTFGFGAASPGSVGDGPKPGPSRRVGGRARRHQPETGAPARRRGRSLAAGFLCAALAAPLGVFVSSAAQADVLISNLSKSHSAPVSVGKVFDIGSSSFQQRSQAIGFTTGPVTGGYPIISVRAVLDGIGSGDGVGVRIFRSSGGTPGSSLFGSLLPWTTAAMAEQIKTHGTAIVSSMDLSTAENRCRALCRISVEDEFDRCASRNRRSGLKCRESKRRRLEMCILWANDNPRERLKRHAVQESCSYLNIHRPVVSGEPAEARSNDGRTARSFRDRLKSGGTAPEMLSLSPGRFATQRHVVTIGKPFAISRYEISFEEWDLCILRGGCNGYRPNDEGWGRGRRPAVNVSWYDAQAYVEWLSRETDGTYRLPSESEWEYAARSGASTAFGWGSVAGRNNANCDGCASRWDNSRTAPVGSFPPNAFGLHDVHGNVWEWVEDCWEGRKRTRQTPFNKDGCAFRVLRGGSWTDKAKLLTFASRLRYAAENRTGDAGFRIVREVQ